MAKPRGKPFEKGVSGNPAGKPPGIKNKFPSALKDKVLHACAHLEAQGKDLATTAEGNPTWFYENFVKPMLPKEVNLLGDATLQIVIKKVTAGGGPDSTD